MSFNPSRLITPPREEEEVYPYHRVWNSLLLEAGLLGGVTIALYLALLIGLTIPDIFEMPLKIGLAILPGILWLLFSYSVDSRVPQPTQQLLQVFIGTVLVAAISIPMVELFFQPAQWLVSADTLTRIIGYTTTSGIIQVMTMYLVQRVTIWPFAYRYHGDALAYATASALAYAVVVNLYYLLTEPAVLPQIMSLRVLHTTTISLITGLLLSYGLVQTAFQRATALMLPLVTLFSAFIAGLAISIRSSLISGSVALKGAVAHPERGAGLSIVLLFGGIALIRFLYQIAQSRDN